MAPSMSKLVCYKAARDRILISLLTLYIQKRKHKKRKHRFWVDNLFKLRENYGAYYHLVQELQFESEQFKAYFRVTKLQFEEIIGRIGNALKKKNLTRKAISPKERLCLTLRYVS